MCEICIAIIFLSDFNSIKVRLKRVSVICTALSVSFQFHKGTIKTAGRPDEDSCSSIFQFHKGTIKTRTPIICLPLVLKFQFHKGTIKTRRSTNKLTFILISIP